MNREILEHRRTSAEMELAMAERSLKKARQDLKQAQKDVADWERIHGERGRKLNSILEEMIKREQP